MNPSIKETVKGVMSYYPYHHQITRKSPDYNGLIDDIREVHPL